MPSLKHSPALVTITSKWFNDQKTSDLQVRLKDDRVLHCHRLFLTAWSEQWAAALEEDEKASSIDLISHDPAIVEKCLKYCYTSEIDFVDDDLTKVHLFAHQYNIKALESACEQMIVDSINGLSASNCMVLYCYLLAHNISSLPDAVQSLKALICREFASASKSSGFLRVPLEVLCDLLKENSLNTHEDDVLDACCRWFDANPNGNDPQVRDQVLRLVRFPMLSAKKLLEFKSHPLMSQCDSLRSRHYFALQWVMTQHVPSSDQEPLRIKLTEENKTEILTPRVSLILPLLQIESRILDADMTKTLVSMLGDKHQVARLLVSSSAGTSPQVFKNAVIGKGPFICIIKSKTGHVFGAYVEDNFTTTHNNYIAGSPNNFLFSLKAIPPQEVVKIKRSATGNGIYMGPNHGLFMGSAALTAFYSSHLTRDDPAFELAPGYESVGTKTLHGVFGHYTPELMEVFAILLLKKKER